MCVIFTLNRAMIERRTKEAKKQTKLLIYIDIKKIEIRVK